MRAVGHFGSKVDKNPAKEPGRKSAAGHSFDIQLLYTKHKKCSKAAAQAVMDKNLKRYSLEFKKVKDDEPNWIGMAAPFYGFLCAHKLRRKEIRLGHNKLPMGKNAQGADFYIDVRDFGLDLAHGLLCEGLGYPPEKKSAIAQSLGPMTQMLMFINTTGSYKDKWKKALANTLRHLPEIETFLDQLALMKSGETRQAVRALANLCLVATTRETSRMYLAPACFVNCMRDWSNTQQNDDIFLMDFSGKGAFAFWKLICKTVWSYSGQMSKEEAAQIFFHSTWGTHKDDLSILLGITNVGTWKSRNEYGKDSFLKGGTSTTMVDFQAPKFLYYAKLTSANNSEFLAGRSSQNCSIPTFSGQQTRHFKPSFFQMIGGGPNLFVSNRSIGSITTLYVNMTSKFAELIEKNGKKQSVGTVKWKDMTQLTFTTPGEVVEGLVVEGSGKLYLGDEVESMLT